MEKVTTIELVKTTTDESLGYAPVIEEKGFKRRMIVDENHEPLTFETRKEAKAYGLEYIKLKK